MAATVRGLVAEAQEEIRDTDLSPERVRVLLARLSALIGNINDEIRQADAAYAAVLLRCLETSDKANHARIKAECSPEYQRKREARDTKELNLELYRAMKHWLKSYSDEIHMSGGQM